MTPETQDLYTGHPQNVVYLNGEWVKVDFQGQFNQAGKLNDIKAYGFLAITQFYGDLTEVDWTLWRLLPNIRAVHLHKILDYRINPSND